MSDSPSVTRGVVWFTAPQWECERGCGCVIEPGDWVAYVADDDYAVVCLACGERAEQEHSPGGAS